MIAQEKQVVEKRKNARSFGSADNMMQLVAELSDRNMSREEICEFLMMGRTGANKYVALLLSHGIVSLTACGSSQAFALIGDEDRVKNFVDFTGQMFKDYRQKAKQKIVVTPAYLKDADPSRHFHIVIHDTRHFVLIDKAPVAPDPLALPAAFFASARDCAPVDLQVTA